MSLKAIWAQNTPYSRFLLSVGIILISSVFFGLLGMVIASLVYQVPLASFETVLANPSDPVAISILKLVQVVAAIGTFIIPAFVLAYTFDGHPARYLGLKERSSAVSMLLVTMIILAAYPLINFLGEVNSHLSFPAGLSGIETWMKELEEKAAQTLETFLDMKGPGDLVMNLFIIGLLPAIGEELLFRGVVQRLFSDLLRNKHAAVWITAVLFSAIHMQFFGFLPRLMLGVLMGYLLVWSGSLWLPILAHFVNNASGILFMYLFREQISGFDPDAIGTQSDYVSVLISVAITGLLLWMVWRRETDRKVEAA